MRSRLDWLFQRPPYAIDAQKDERDAKQLAHIERQGGLKVFLIVLQKLHEEAGGEDADHEDAEDEPLALPGVPLEVEPHAEGEGQEVADGLIELRRV